LTLVLITIAALGNLGLGSAILSKDPKNPVHRYFAGFSFAVAAWTLSNGVVSAYASTPWGYLWARLAFATSAAIPIAFLFFASVFPTATPSPPRGLVRAFSGVAIVAFAVSFTPLMVRGTAIKDGVLEVQHGILHLPFGLYFVSCFGFSLFLLTRKLIVLTGVQKLQVRYLFAGVLTAAVGATLANLLIPLFFRTSQFSRYGPLFGLLMIGAIAHAIIRHRLMDIKLVIRRGVVYISAIVAAASIFVLLSDLIKRATGYEQDSIPLAQALPIALLLAIVFQPLKAWIQSSFNHYLYREVYDYQKTIRHASRSLSTMLDLDPLVSYLGSAIRDTFKAEAVTVYLRDSSAKYFMARRPVGDDEVWPGRTAPLSLALTSPLATFLEGHPTPLVREEALRTQPASASFVAASVLADCGADIAFPLFDDQRLVGVLLVGPKRSGDPYFSNDIDLLDTLISQAAVAMKNATLYRQVVLANEYVDNILSTMDSGVIAVDGAGRVSLFNAAAELLTDFRRDDVLGEPCKQLPSALAMPLQDTLESQVALSQFETSIPSRGDGTQTPLVCSTAVLRHRDGTVHGALMVFSDLTRIKDLEREKQRAERLASFGTLASGVAHEIKNPLVAIRTFAELLPERFADTDFREDFAKVVITEIDRIDDLVARLRGLAATSPQRPRNIDIRGPLSETLRLLRAQLEQTRTTVHYHCLDETPIVAVDEAQLKQLFLNLFLNAIEAMGPGGELSIQVSRRDLRGDQWIVAEVSDNGPGIPDSVRANVFNPFFTTKPRGSGLGLAICRGIVDAHKGTIRANNRLDRSGTVLVVEFPASSAVALDAEVTAVKG
jgi:PAS domain S-box-containing protein